jgi:hypothetical protein
MTLISTPQTISELIVLLLYHGKDVLSIGLQNFLFRYGFSLFPAAQFLMAYIASKTVAHAIYMFACKLPFACIQMRKRG